MQGYTPIDETIVPTPDVRIWSFDRQLQRFQSTFG